MAYAIVKIRKAKELNHYAIKKEESYNGNIKG